MGSRIDDIEREIRQKRGIVEERVTNVRSRVDGDLSSVQAEAQTRAEKVVAGAKDAIQGAGEKVELEERMRDNPYPILAAGVGAGALLGFVTSGGAGHEEHGGHGGRSTGLLSGVLSPITGRAIETVRAEVQGIVSEKVSEFVESVKSQSASAKAHAMPDDSAIEV